jgi:hypothetical protein
MESRELRLMGEVDLVIKLNKYSHFIIIWNWLQIRHLNLVKVISFFMSFY